MVLSAFIFSFEKTLSCIIAGQGFLFSTFNTTRICSYGFMYHQLFTGLLLLKFLVATIRDFLKLPTNTNGYE